MENTIINNENNAEFLAKRITDLLGLIANLENRINFIDEQIEELQENHINPYDDIFICEDRLDNIDILIDNLQERINTIEEQ